MLDTKNFTARVTSRTFDVASYLRTRGSDSLEIQHISATDFAEYRQVNELILKGQKMTEEIVIVCGEENQFYDNIVPSKAANTILEMAGIEATFVVVRRTSEYVAISARSRSKVNVQRIMEEMGGGGHFNLAAAQISGKSIEQVQLQLREKILSEIEGE